MGLRQIQLYFSKGRGFVVFYQSFDARPLATCANFPRCTGASEKASKRASPIFISLEVSRQSHVMYKLSYCIRSSRGANVSIRRSPRALFLPCCFSHDLWFLPVLLWMSRVVVLCASVYGNSTCKRRVAVGALEGRTVHSYLCWCHCERPPLC